MQWNWNAYGCPNLAKILKIDCDVGFLSKPAKGFQEAYNRRSFFYSDYGMPV